MKRTILNAAKFVTLLGAVSCSTLSPPPELVTVREFVTGTEISALEMARKDLVRQARVHHFEAERALENRREGVTLWQARLAEQKLSIARDLTARDQALAARDVLVARDLELQAVETEVIAQRREWQRMRALQSKVAGLEGQLAAAAGARDSNAARVKQALVRARTKQAEAVGAGAASRAQDTYQQGRVLLEAAIESMRNELFEQGEAAANRAAKAFEAAIEIAGRNPPVEAPTVEPSQTTVAANIVTAPTLIADPETPADTALRATTRAAIEAAEDARAKVADHPQASLARGDYELSLARNSEDSHPNRARTKARAAAVAFKALADRHAPGATTSSAAVKLAEVPAPYNSAPGAGLSGRLPRHLDALLLQWELLRADLLASGRAGSCGTLLESSATLARLSRERFERGDMQLAQEFAVRASEQAKSCERAWMANPGTPTQQSVTASDKNTDADLARSAEAAMARAEAALAEAEGEPIYKSKLASPKGLLQRAERWYERGRMIQAKQLADGAHSEVRRLRAEVDEAQAKLQAEPTPADKAEAQLESEANKEMRKAQIEVAAAAGRAPDAPRLAEAKSLLRAATQWLQLGRLADARSMAQRSIKVASSIRAPEPTVVVASKLQTLDIATTTSSVTAALGRTRDAQLLELGALQARSQRLPDDQSVLIESVSGALTAVSQAHAQGDFERAGRLLNHADSVLNGAEAMNSAANTPDPGTPIASDPAAEATRLLLLDVSIARERAQSVTTPEGLRLMERARRFEEQGRRAQRGGDHVAAQRFGEAAAEELQEALSLHRAELQRVQTASIARQRAARRAPEARAPAPRTADPRLAKAPGSQTPPVVAETVEPRSRRTPEIEAPRPAVVQSAPVNVSVPTAEIAPTRTEPAAPPPTDESWRPMYSEVTDTLILRDRVRTVAEPEDARRMGLTDAYIDRAHVAWKRTRYSAAVSLARAAKEEMQGVLTDIETRKIATKAQAEQARQEAETARKEELAKEQALALTASKRAGETSAQRRASQDQARARDDARQAKEEAERNKANAEANAEARGIAKAEAADAIREATVRREACKRRGCETRDFETWTRGTKGLEAATQAQADGEFARANQLAKDSAETLLKIPDGPPQFALPEDVVAVQLSKGQLEVTPRLEFASGKTKLASDHVSGLDTLAKVILPNVDSIQTIEIVGFTDSLGSKNTNMRISRMRAEAIRDGLIARSVPAGLLRASGRGPQDPIADNATAEGRRMNRRIEIRLHTHVPMTPAEK